MFLSAGILQSQHLPGPSDQAQLARAHALHPVPLRAKPGEAWELEVVRLVRGTVVFSVTVRRWRLVFFSPLTVGASPLHHFGEVQGRTVRYHVQQVSPNSLHCQKQASKK